MAEPISLEPRLDADLLTLGGGAPSREAMPPDLLQDIARRLKFTGLLICGLAPVSLLVTLAAGQILPLAARLASTAAMLGAGGAVAWIAGRPNVSPRRLLDIGSAFAVFLALIISLASVPATWFASQRAGVLWSPVAVWVLIFPLIVPASRRRTLVTASLAAATEPAVVFGLVLVGHQSMPPIGTFLLNAWPNVVAVALAVLVSSTVYRLGQKLARVRSMGSYQLVRLLGRGGMGEVWRARHRLLAREAALKIIQPAAMGSASRAEAADMIRRFEREAQATAALRSPHTIELYDFGIAQNGAFYYVMELLDGIDLDRLVQVHGPQAPARCVYVLRQACHSLHEAHVRGLVHRDIKPANIFLCRHGTDLDFVKVLDFGLVRERRQGEEGEAAASAEGKLSGTPAFLAPEMLVGSGAVDGRADLYGLGCVAYWLLAGCLVFERVNSFEMTLAHATEAPADIRSRAPIPIPDSLAAIVMRCLAKDPGQRPVTARALADELAVLGIEGEWTESVRDAWWREQRPAKAGRESGLGDGNTDVATEVIAAPRRPG